MLCVLLESVVFTSTYYYMLCVLLESRVAEGVTGRRFALERGAHVAGFAFAVWRGK